MSSLDPEEETLEALGLVLPEPPRPIATYVPAIRAGSLLFLSGMLPLAGGRPTRTGRLGASVTVEEGAEAARTAVLNALSVVKAEAGSLGRVRRVVKLVGYVAATPDFSQHPAVLNGASDLLVAVFGDRGRHARVAIGAASLPLDCPVELELTVEVE